MKKFSDYLEMIQESEPIDIAKHWRVSEIQILKNLQDLMEEDLWTSSMGAQRIVFNYKNKIYFMSGDFAPEKIQVFSELNPKTGEEQKILYKDFDKPADQATLAKLI